jgi:hypothetical protein
MNNRPYIAKTAAQLIDAYCFEHNRIDPKDKQVTQALIEKELRTRFETMLKMLKRPECKDAPNQIYEYFTHEYTRN